MALKIIDWLTSKVSSAEVKQTDGSDCTVEYDHAIDMSHAAEEIAVCAATSLIAGSLERCEFMTLQDGQPKREDEWQLWNVAPNPNDSKSDFCRKLVYRLVRDKKALVIEKNLKLYVADGFDEESNGFANRKYTNIRVCGEEIKSSYTPDNAMCFRLPDMSEVPTHQIEHGYSQLITTGAKGFKRSQGMHGTLELDAQAMGNERVRGAYEKLRDNGFKRFADAETSVMTLYKGMTYTDVAQKTYSNQSSRDIRAMIDDISDYKARRLNIPPCLLNGSVQNTEDARKQLVAFCLIPLFASIESEINRRRYTPKQIAQNSCLKIDTTALCRPSWTDAASSIDKLIACGIFCVNDALRLLGMPEIDEEWAKTHYITKNYGELYSASKGGENE